MAKNKEERTIRVNQQIRAKKVLVVYEGKKIGEMPPFVALQKAKDLGLDLVEVSPHANPPVCIIVNYGKYRYNKTKKTKQQQPKRELKTVRFRPNTDDHDVETKVKSIRKFLESKKKVLILVKSKGRELTHKDRSFDIVQKIVESVEDIGKLDAKPISNGQNVSCRIDPIY
ncbi:MAG: translation initiation factor IF-3 [Gammaproteobacteria bacterium]|nr:MAG: translation initiation factor IF-3 [Gammaproteobacteria bacterium]